MNIYEAYIGAVKGLEPRLNGGHIRDLQYAIPLELAYQRRRGQQIDGQVVSSEDLARLKQRGEKRLK